MSEIEEIRSFFPFDVSVDIAPMKSAFAGAWLDMCPVFFECRVSAKYGDISFEMSASGQTPQDAAQKMLNRLRETYTT